MEKKRKGGAADDEEYKEKESKEKSGKKYGTRAAKPKKIDVDRTQTGG